MIEEQKRQFNMFVPDDDGSAMDWLENTISQALQAERERLVEEIREIESDLQGHQAYTAVERIITIINK